MTDVGDRVRDYACAVLGDCAPDRVVAVQRFDAGERHHVFKASYVNDAGHRRDVVVRVSLRDDADERDRAVREASVLETVGGVAGPRLHDFRVESPWFDAPAMCLQLVHGEQRELRIASSGDLERLGALVSSLHALPVDPLAASFPETGDAASYRTARLAQVRAYLPSVRDPLPSPLQRRIEAALRSIDARLDQVSDAPLVLLHGDIAGGNIIWGPDPVLIDWEYARIGDAADEIAYTFTQNGFTDAQRDAFWRAYRRGAAVHADDDLVDRVRWWEPVTLLGSALWWIERWACRVAADAAGETDPTASRPATYYLEQARRRLERLNLDCR